MKINLIHMLCAIGGFAGKARLVAFVGMMMAVFPPFESANAAQPYETISREPMKYFVKQGPAQCGPASFYIIFKYYGDNLRRYPFFYDREGSPVDLGAGTGKAADGTDTVSGDDPVAVWIKGSDSSTGWKKLVASVQELCHKNDRDMRTRYYEVVDSYDEVTGADSRGRDVRKINFLERIVPGFLEKNRPVIIHLKRKWPFPGHYVVVIGFDGASGKVYYMDPNDAGPVDSVSFNDFIDEFWYRGNAPSLWGKARWSGKWLGFYRIGDGSIPSAPEK